MKTAFVFLAILATAMASSTRRWGSSQPEPADDPECKKNSWEALGAVEQREQRRQQNHARQKMAIKK